MTRSLLKNKNVLSEINTLEFDIFAFEKDVGREQTLPLVAMKIYELTGL